MSFLSNLFNKIFGKKKSLEELLSLLSDAQNKGSFMKIAELYYEVGQKYLEEGQDEKAFLYINRFDSLSSSDDAIYEKFSEKVEQASKWIEILEQKDFFTNRLRDLADEKGMSLDLTQKIQWNLLTLARFCVLFERLSILPGFDVFKNYNKVTEILTQSLYHETNEEELDILNKFILDFYSFADSKALADTRNRISVDGSDDFEAYDLIGAGTLTLLNIHALLDDLAQIAAGNDIDDINVDLVTNALLADYYIRTKNVKPDAIPALNDEKARIFGDYEFILSNPSEVDFTARMNEYKKLSLPA